ncbi:MAG: PA3496 family putative envelope integrity protein [Pseudomonadota bacterium]
MSEAKSIDDLDDILPPASDSGELPDESAKATIDKDTRRKLEDALEERRLKKAIEDDYLS